MHPTPRCAWLFAAGVPLALAPAVVDERLDVVWALVAAISCALVLCDAALALPRARVECGLDLPAEIVLGRPAAAALTICSRGRATRFTLVADLEERLAPQPAITIDVPYRGEATAELPLVATRRGPCVVSRIWLRWTGPFGLVARTWERKLDAHVPAVQDVGAARAVALRFFGSRALTIGLKVERFAGEGSEFESLRTWTPGLDPRGVDWKASARHRRLVCRRFRAERNHQLIAAIDCGHLMSEPLAGIPRVDHAVQRALALAWLALRTGDRVGLFGFDAEPRAFVEPQAGVRAFTVLRRAAAALEYGDAETNFALGLLSLTERLRRRSLVVVFTEFADSITSELMLDHVARLARRHVVIFVALRDPAVETLVEDAPTRLLDVHRAVVAGGLRAEREAVLQRLRRARVHVVDAEPDSATVQLLNRYLDIKRRELVS
ncbi:MAG: DUF58 domain-containing protein [Planctomycetes bacterium]|nr:DUF58 domain-containing protein [Planctomycetota bacterium]